MILFLGTIKKITGDDSGSVQAVGHGGRDLAQLED